MKKKAAKKPVKKAAKKPVKKVIRKSAGKPVKKATKKTAVRKGKTLPRVKKPAAVKAVSKKPMKKSQPVRPKKAVKVKSQRPRKFAFTKMVASGNDFIVFDNRRGTVTDGQRLALKLCPRTTGIGADGLILIERSRRADFRMRIFNPDGTEAEMCGNGSRCAALFRGKNRMTVETLAGILEAERKDGQVIKVRMSPPRDLNINLNLEINGRFYQVNCVNTGVPHAIYMVENIDTANVRLLGRLIRYHRDLQPEGTNVDFVQIEEEDLLRIRTYERGVEAETMACGTGSVAAALVYHQKFLRNDGTFLVEVLTVSGEKLKVYLNFENGEYTGVWLEGRAEVVYTGECYV